METKDAILYLYAETPLHVGTGTGLGAVDMPIQREIHTKYPMIQASGVKGALRDTTEIKYGQESDIVMSIFGGETTHDGKETTHAGAVSPSDARILCFPVRALNGVFVWISSPVVLERYIRETRLSDNLNITTFDGALVADKARLISDKVMLEEFTYTGKHDAVVQDIAEHIAGQVFPNNTYWRDRMVSHFVVLPDDEFRDFVRYSTEIVTRIKIDSQTKTVSQGALFTQELLPADSVLYSHVRVTDTREGQGKNMAAGKVLDKLKGAIGNNIQIGGDETVGRGRMHVRWGGEQ